MLLTPFVSAAVLLRQISWQEAVGLLAIVCAFIIKDPLIVIARQRFVWKQGHPETKLAVRYAAAESAVLVACGFALILTRDWRPFLPLFAGAGAFTVLAVIANVRNWQRSEWFQIASAVGLTATCLVACLSVLSSIPEWCWLLWFLSALQATAGIFVVHARLDARIAVRKPAAADGNSRRAARIAILVLLIAAAFFVSAGRFWIAAALLIAATAYFLELRRQRDRRSLQIPLTSVGKQALGLSIVYAAMIIAGLW